MMETLKAQVKTNRGWKTVFGPRNQRIAIAWKTNQSKINPKQKRRLVYIRIDVCD